MGETEPGAWMAEDMETKHSEALFGFNDTTWDAARDAAGIVCFFRWPG